MRIWKFPLEVVDLQELRLPPKSKLLTVQMQYGKPCLWVLLDENTAVNVGYKIAIYGTGNPLPDNPGEYIATFQMHGGDLVFHVFEVK